MRKIALILALVGAALAAAGQALPSGSVKFGTMTWLAPDGGVWTGSSFTGYNQVMSLNMTGLQTVAGDVVFTKPLSSTSFLATGAAISDGMNVIAGPGNAGGLVGIDGNETKFMGFIQDDNEFVIGYGTTTPGQHSGQFSIDLPTGNAVFSGKVRGQPATISNEFVTLGQLSAPATYKVPYQFRVMDGIWDNSPDTILVNVPLQEDGYWDGSTEDEGWSIEFEIRGNLVNSGIDNRLALWFGRGPLTFSSFFNVTIPQGSIPAQEFWLNGTLTKTGPIGIRYDLEFKTGDPAGVTSHRLQSGTISGLSAGWNLETNPTNLLRLSCNSATPTSLIVTHARFKKVPLNGTFISNL